MDYLYRQSRLLQEMSGQRLDGILVTHMPNIRYLCGFTGSAGVLALIGGRQGKMAAAFFTDGRYTQQARDEAKGAKVFIPKSAALFAATEWLITHDKIKAIGFEADRMTVTVRANLQKAFPHKLRLTPTSGLVERLRRIKEPEEIQQIRAAVLLASSVFEAVLADIKPGITEASLAAEIEYMSRRMGAEGMSFETLVAAGTRSALPHGVATQNPLPSNGFVILDFGVILGGYCSDMTRTVHLGRPNKASKKMYQAVLEAQLAGIKAVTPGVKCSEVDYATRKVLEKAGLARYFTHSTGHGVGIEIHELPGLRKGPKIEKQKKSGKLGRRKLHVPFEETLQPGMVVTIEPGVYIPGVGGVRIEDMVLVTDSGCEVLTPTRKDLLVI